MKRTCISFLILTIIMLTAIGLSIPNKQTAKVEYLRIHVRANSNSELDQNVKYKVKDAVVKYLTPYIAECDTKQKAQTVLNGCLSGVELVANGVLANNNFAYTTRAELRSESFPTRVYENLTLEAGVYDALILELGDGLGDNWWCVVYPPLCFVDGGANYVYKSKILEIINGFSLNKQKGV